MSTILVFCVLATLAWLGLSLISRASDTGPKDSVDDFSRALSALASEPVGHRRAAARRGARRGVGRRPRRRPDAAATRRPPGRAPRRVSTR